MTENNFVDMVIDMPDDLMINTITLFVKQNLNSVSQSLFEHLMTERPDINFPEALSAAILNHQVSIALRESMNKPVINKTEVFCKLVVEGLHNWPNCDLKEVNYLSLLHRHNFVIKAYVDVSHDDRDVEFIKLKHDIIEYLGDKYYDRNKRIHDFKNRSCEMIARELIEAFNLTKCEVSEDDECGSIVTK